MATYRTCRPMMVEATQCCKAETITTDLGFIHVKRGEWIIRGENGECYVVDDAFFQRTFVSAQQTNWTPPLQTSQDSIHRNTPNGRIASGRCFRRHRRPRAFRRRASSS